MVRRLAAASLEEYQGGVARKAEACEARVDASLASLRALGLWVADDAADGNDDTRPKLCVVWELRNYLPESVALAHALPKFMADFVKNRFNFKRATEDAGSESVQIDFFAALLHVVDRTPCRADAVPMHETTWTKKDPERLKKWAAWEALLVESQERLAVIPVACEADRESLKLKVPPG